MTLLDRYFAARLVTTFLRTVSALVALFVFIDLMTNRREDILEQDVPTQIVIQYYLAYIPTILQEYQVAAIAVLISALFVFGTASQQNEITAMFASGVGRNRIARVPVLLAILLCIALYVVEETIGPASVSRTLEIENRYFSHVRRDARRGVSWTHLDDDWKCHIRKFNRKAMTGEDVLMLSPHAETEEQIRAQRIVWDEDTQTWLIEDGVWSVFFPERGMEVITRRITQEKAPITASPESLFALEGHPGTKTIAQLRTDIKHAQALGMPVPRLAVDLHSKFARPLLCVIMVWIAMAFAIQIRRGGFALGLGLGLAIGLSYLIVFSLSQALGYLGRIPPPVAAWFANALFLVIGLVLFSRTPT